jgi:uncharacterized coiled-coil DUF342 family protein
MHFKCPPTDKPQFFSSTRSLKFEFQCDKNDKATKRRKKMSLVESKSGPLVEDGDDHLTPYWKLSLVDVHDTHHKIKHGTLSPSPSEDVNLLVVPPGPGPVAAGPSPMSDNGTATTLDTVSNNKSVQPVRRARSLSMSVVDSSSDVMQFANLITRMMHTEAAVDAHEQDLQKAAEIGQSLLAQLATMESELQNANANVTASETTIADLQDELAKTKRTNKEIIQHNAAVETENAQIMEGARLLKAVHDGVVKLVSEEVPDDLITSDVIDDFRTFRRRYHTKLKRLESMKDHIEEDNHALKDENAGLRNKVASLKQHLSEIDQLRQDNHALKDQIHFLEQSTTEAKNRALDKLRTQAAADLESHKHELEQLDAEHNQVLDEKKQLEQQLRSLQQAHTLTLDELQDAQQSEAQLSQTKRTLEAVQSELKIAHDDLQAMNSMVDEWHTERVKNQRELRQLRQEHQQLNHQLEQIKQHVSPRVSPGPESNKPVDHGALLDTNAPYVGATDVGTIVQLSPNSLAYQLSQIGDDSDDDSDADSDAKDEQEPSAEAAAITIQLPNDENTDTESDTKSQQPSDTPAEQPGLVSTDSLPERAPLAAMEVQQTPVDSSANGKSNSSRDNTDPPKATVKAASKSPARSKAEVSFATPEKASHAAKHKRSRGDKTPDGFTPLRGIKSPSLTKINMREEINTLRAQNRRLRVEKERLANAQSKPAQPPVDGSTSTAISSKNHGKPPRGPRGGSRKFSGPSHRNRTHVAASPARVRAPLVSPRSRADSDGPVRGPMVNNRVVMPSSNQRTISVEKLYQKYSAPQAHSSPVRRSGIARSSPDNVYAIDSAVNGQATQNEAERVHRWNAIYNKMKNAAASPSKK